MRQIPTWEIVGYLSASLRLSCRQKHAFDRGNEPVVLSISSPSPIFVFHLCPQLKSHKYSTAVLEILEFSRFLDHQLATCISQYFVFKPSFWTADNLYIVVHKLSTCMFLKFMNLNSREYLETTKKVENLNIWFQLCRSSGQVYRTCSTELRVLNSIQEIILAYSRKLSTWTFGSICVGVRVEFIVHAARGWEYSIRSKRQYQLTFCKNLTVKPIKENANWQAVYLTIPTPKTLDNNTLLAGSNEQLGVQVTWIVPLEAILVIMSQMNER